MSEINKLSPKFDFLSLRKKSASKWQDFVTQPEMKEVVYAALAEYVTTLDANSPVTAPKMGGAREFARMLLNFGNQDNPVHSSDPEELTPV